MEEENIISSEGTTQLPSESQESESITEKDLHEPTQESTPNPEPTSVTSTVDVPKKNIFKFFKTIPGIITIAAVVACIVLAIVFINKHSKEKAYEENLKEFIVESGKASMASAYICEDLRTIWHDYIFEDKEFFDRSSGTFTQSWGSGDTYCSSFSEAVNKKIAWNKEHLPSSITEPYYKAKRLYKEMTPPPSKYKDVHVYVKQMFKAMERLHGLSEDPTGNLSTYSSNCNQAVEEYTSSLSDLTNECDIDFSKVGDKDNKDDEFED